MYLYISTYIYRLNLYINKDIKMIELIKYYYIVSFFRIKIVFFYNVLFIVNV